MNETTTKFWERFYGLCLENGTKPNPVGKELGLYSGIVTKWKYGGFPSGKSLVSLANYFGVTIDYLVGRSNQKYLGDSPNDNDEAVLIDR